MKFIKISSFLILILFFTVFFLPQTINATIPLPYLGWYEGRVQINQSVSNKSYVYSKFSLYRDEDGDLKSYRKTHQTIDPSSPIGWENTQDATYVEDQQKLNIGRYADGTTGYYLEGQLRDDGHLYAGKGYEVKQNSNPFYPYSGNPYEFSYKYLGPFIFPEDIEILGVMYEISVKNWIEKTFPSSPIQINDSDISFSKYKTDIIQNLTLSNGNLEFAISPGAISPGDIQEFEVHATFNKTKETKTFKIIISPQPTPSQITSPMSRKLKKEYSSISNSTEILQSFKSRIPSSPSNDELIQSFEELLSLPLISQEIQSSDPAIRQSIIDQIKLMSGMIFEKISTFKIPSLNMADTTNSFVTDVIQSLYENTYTTILKNQAKLNRALENANILFRLEHIIVFDAIDIWNDNENLIHIPYTFLNQIFDHGFTATLLRTSQTTVALRDDTIMPRDSIQYLFFEKPETITFHSEKIDEEQHMYSLHLYKDESPLTNFSNYLSVQPTYEHNDAQTENLLRVIYQKDPYDPTLNQNVGGIFNPDLNRMIFSTNHFSVFFIQTGTPSINSINNQDSQWAKSILDSLASKGIISEDVQGSFSPNNNITRSETAVMIATAFKLLNPNAKSDFTDVPTTDSAYSHISSLNKLGIIKGSDNLFRPNDNISRQDAAIILLKTLLFSYRESLKLVNNPHEVLEPFGDHGVSDYAVKYVATLVKLNILKGDANGNLNPKDPLTKAQMSALIYQGLQLQKVQGLPFTGTQRIQNVN
jgi:hypothetical protein